MSALMDGMVVVTPDSHHGGPGLVPRSSQLKIQYSHTSSQSATTAAFHFVYSLVEQLMPEKYISAVF